MKKLNDRGCQVVAYAEVFVRVVKCKFLSTVYALTQGYSNVVTSLWDGLIY